MASKRHIRQIRCGKKRRFVDEETARRELLWLAKNGKFSGLMAPYKCSFCHHWHLGHSEHRRGHKVKGVSYQTMLDQAKTQ